jgi:hypothetical protein
MPEIYREGAKGAKKKIKPRISPISAGRKKQLCTCPSIHLFVFFAPFAPSR